MSARLEEFVDRDQWLAARRTGIGASEVPAALGLSRWQSPFGLWAQKTGRAQPPKDNEDMRRGRDLEPVIARAYAEESGVTLSRPSPAPFYLMRHSDLSWLSATPDYVTAADGKLGLLECKSPGLRAESEWKGEEPPVEAQVQLQAQLCVTGYDGGVIAALLMSSWRTAWKRYAPHADFLAAALPRLEAFVHAVSTERPPREVSAGDLALLREIYPGAPQAPPMEMGADWADAWDELDELTEQIRCAKKVARAAETAKASLEARIRMELKDARLGRLPDGRVFRLTSYERRGYTVQPTTVHQLKQQ